MKAPAVTFVTPWYGHFAGGAEVAARMFATQLARRGFTVQVLTTCCRSPYESWWQNTLSPGESQLDGVLVRRFPVNPHGEQRFHETNARLSDGADFGEQDQQAFIDATINSDELIAFARQNLAGHVVIAMPYTQGVVHQTVRALPGAVTLVPCLHDEMQARWTTTSQMIAGCRRLCFLSEEEKSLAVRLYGDKLGRRVAESAVIGVGVELPVDVRRRLSGATPANDVRRQYKLPPRYFVYVGRKDTGKNVPRMVHWFDEHRQAGSADELVFVGGGDASLAPGGTGFRDLGYVPEADKYAILSEATALVNLSENESFSLVVAEAWQCGVPVVVSSRSPVTASHCRRSRGGIAVGTADEFHAALESLTAEDTRREMAAAGAAYVRREYSWDTVLDRFLAEAA